MQLDRFSESHPRLFALVAAARNKGVLPTAVVFPDDETSLQAASSAEMAGLIKPVLYGNKQKIQAIASKYWATDAIAIVDTGAEARAAAQAAIAATHRGEHLALMKGSLHTDELLSEVLQIDGGLRTVERLTHTFVFDLPRYHKLLAVTDAVVNITPNLAAKIDALTHAVAVMQRLGIVRVKCAVVAAVEVKNPAIPATIEAATLAELGRNGRFGTALVEGPFGFDNAISKIAARMKGIDSEVAGDPDVLLVPDLNAGNMLYKSFVYIGGGECAGVVQGASVPIILTSRADSAFSRLASCALASLVHGECAPD
jgi:phosphate acetyltransferase